MLAGSGAAVAVVLIALALVWASGPSRVVLFSELDPVAAAAIVAELEDAGVRHDVTRGGTTILVPADRVGELRIRVAARGLTGKRPLGYELLDRSSIGMTEFLQHVNHRRALEGELSRTIASVSEVRSARIHLAIPERSASTDDRSSPTASAIVELEPGARLGPEQVRGMVALVAASVEGLGASGVTIVDSSGRQLAGASSEEFAASSEQLRRQREIEEHLREKASSLLEQVVGEGQVIVRVHADLDFERVERSVERWDPSSTAVRSEQVTAGGEAVATEYEVDHTVAKILGSIGTIRRLTVAVLVDHDLQTAPDGTITYVERSPRELSTLSAIVRDAVGWDEGRGDSLEMANLRFAETRAADAPSVVTPAWWALLEGRGPWIRLGAILAAVVVVGWTVRRSAAALVTAVAESRTRNEAVFGIELQTESEAELRKEVIRDEMHNLAKERPGEVAQVLRGWLVEEKSS
jgi:flagellar M-ring protein FliF